MIKGLLLALFVVTNLNPNSNTKLNTGIPGASAQTSEESPKPNLAIWLWKTRPLISDEKRMSTEITTIQETGVTDVFVFVPGVDYTDKADQLRNFNRRLNAAGIRPWGMDGGRVYFSDESGPTEIYQAVNQMLAFNSKASDQEKFVGFNVDIEPDHSDYLGTFHSNLTNSQLNNKTGGVWFATEVEDREALLRDWLEIHANVSEILSKQSTAQGQKLLLSTSMPTWADLYFNESLSVTYKGVRQSVMKHMMDIVDWYVMMSYKTNPPKLILDTESTFNYGDSIWSSRPVKVFGGVETNPGFGVGVSYADTPEKQSKGAVMRDLVALNQTLRTHPSFSGFAIDDWDGWVSLDPSPYGKGGVPSTASRSNLETTRLVSVIIFGLYLAEPAFEWGIFPAGDGPQ